MYNSFLVSDLSKKSKFLIHRSGSFLIYRVHVQPGPIWWFQPCFMFLSESVSMQLIGEAAIL